MFKHIYYQRITSLINRLFWKHVFSKHFKEYGRKSHIFMPDYIVGDEFITIKSDVYIGYKSSIIALSQNNTPPNLFIGHGTKIRRFAHIVCISEVIIEDKVLIADKVFIADNIHGYQKPDMPIVDQPLEFVSKVRIGEGTCIGENVCIIGAKIGRNCTIGANSVVTKNIPDYSIAVGAPAKVIKTYDFDKSEWINVK